MISVSELTDWDLDAALKSLENEKKILIDKRDNSIIWLVPEDEGKVASSYVTLKI